MPNFVPRRLVPFPPVLLPFLLMTYLALTPGMLQAHFRTISYSKWIHSDAGWNVRVRVPVLELERLFGMGAWNEETVRAYLLQHVRIQTETGPCSPTWLGDSVKLTDFVANVSFNCDGPAQTIFINAFFESAPSHLHYARIHEGRKVFERIVTASSSSISLVRDESDDFFTNAFNAGLRHLFSGFEHILFLTGLVLLATSRTSLMKIIASFTASYALTFSMLTLGLVKAAPRSVEALIGLSIVVIAVELLIRSAPVPQAWRWRAGLSIVLAAAAIPAALGEILISPLALLGVSLILLGLIALDATRYANAVPWIHATGFGLIFGMGTAGAINAVNGISNEGSLLNMMLGFNLGVLFGQTVIAVILYVLFTRILRMVKWLPAGNPIPQELAATALITVGTYLFVGRALGLT